MKISTKGRYALRLMLDIAMHDAAGPVRIKDVAARRQFGLGANALLREQFSVESAAQTIEMRLEACNATH